MDLGLPSGTLWAAMNVGASKPSDSGLLFQWGDTVGYTADQVGTGGGKKKFASDWSDYKWYLSGSGNDINFKKYADNTGATLALEDDAAHVNMGGDWHMPSPTQIKELIDNTTSEWATLDGVSGMGFMSNKDASKIIVFPAAGGVWDGSVKSIGNLCRVWSSMLSMDSINDGRGLLLNPGDRGFESFNRYFGFSVRGVLG